MSNVTGSLTDFNLIKEKVKKFDIPVMVDGCQYVAHSKLNVSELNCDFYVFSGHKLYGPSGVGVLYMKDKWFIAPAIEKNGNKGLVLGLEF